MSDLLTLHPHAKDLGGGFQVRRVLPAAQRRAVGPFVSSTISVRPPRRRRTSTMCGPIRTSAWRR